MDSSGAANASTTTSSNSATTWYHFIGNNSIKVEANQAEASIREKYPLLLRNEERIELAFKGRGGLGRDKSYFTTHRILLKDGKGIGSKRKNYKSIFYKDIQAFSVETAGSALVDGDMDVKVFAKGGRGRIQIDFAANTDMVDLFEIQQYLNTKIRWLRGQRKDRRTSQNNDLDYVCGEPLQAKTQHAKTDIGRMFDWIGSNAHQLSPSAVEQQFKTQFPVLMANEVVELAFHAGRDYTLFTNIRIMIIDVKGLMGKKIEFQSFPWGCCSGFSVETAGAYFDRDSEMSIYTNIMDYGIIRQDFRKSAVDILAIQKYLCNQILGNGGDNEHTNYNNQVLSNVDLKQGHVDPKTSWWFRDNQRPLDAVEMNNYYHTTIPLLQHNESIEFAFKGRRDITLFTTKRIIDVDPKGWKGVKIEYRSVPWRSVLAFGVKTAGKHFDKDCEALVWTDMMYNPGSGDDDPPTPGMSHFEMGFNKDLVDIIAMKNYLSQRCLIHNDVSSGAVPNIPVPQNVFMISNTESGMEKFFSKIGNDQRAIDPREIDNDLHSTQVLLTNETTIMAFKAGRDLTLFTNLRILILDVQGWSGQKVKYTSIPYKSIRAFSAESAGGWDRDSEIDIYTRNLWNLSKVEMDFRKGKADIISIQKFLSAIVLDDSPNKDEAGKYLNSREPIIPQTNPVKLDSFISWLRDNMTPQEDLAAVDGTLHSSPPILLDDEDVERAYRAGRDMFVYTTHRLLLIDVQGIQGKKVEYKSIPYTWCTGYEFETAGPILDKDVEVYNYADIPRMRVVKQSILVKHCDVYEVAAFVHSLRQSTS